MFFKPVVSFAVLLAAQIAAAQTCSRTYTVQEGDTCDSISAANNASTYQVAVVNYGNVDPQCDNLTPGESICLGFAGEDCQTTYVVQLGDTCDDISSAYGVNTTILSTRTVSNIYVGEVLCTACTVEVPPAPGGSPAPSVVQPPPTAVPANPSGDGGDDDDLPWCD
ncbi:hypothetical protein BKA82DRAFT_4236050 [Pisolithus tinctorius]|nr:hypothetical protein BKA82DRAFT_4236050 [Pisolithus tinctorius]